VRSALRVQPDQSTGHADFIIFRLAVCGRLPVLFEAGLNTSNITATGPAFSN